MITPTEIKPRSEKQLARSAAIKAANDAKRRAANLASLLGPRVVGSRCFCGYWRTLYTVTAILGADTDQPMITVLWDDRNDRARAAHSTTHCTRWDARGGDRIIAQVEVAS